MKKQIMKEQMRKRVVRSGNSGAVWVPKGWLGEEIVVTRLETSKLSLEEELINILRPYLKDISGIFLYGSYARKEETKDSDKDILLIAKNKINIENTKKFDINVIELARIKETVQKNPFVYAIIHEAKPIMNSSLLDELKQTKKNFKQFITWFKETTKDSMKSIKGLIELDSIESKHIMSHSIIYSLILRLRGIFLIKSVLHNRKFSNASFKKFITKHIPEFTFKRIYTIYRKVRDNKKVEAVKIEIDTAKKLLEILQQETRNLNAK